MGPVRTLDPAMDNLMVLANATLHDPVRWGPHLRAYKRRVARQERSEGVTKYLTWEQWMRDRGFALHPAPLIRPRDAPSNWLEDVTGVRREPPVLRNVVCTAELSSTLSLLHIASHVPCKYHRKRFTSVIIRFSEPKATILAFASGSLVCTGTSTVETTHYVVDSLVRMLRKTGLKYLQASRIGVRNIVCSVYIGFSLDLAAIHTMHSSEANLRADVFPGLIFRSIDFTKITLLVFSSGQMVITGAKNEKDATSAYLSLRPLLAMYRVRVGEQRTTEPTPAAEQRAQYRNWVCEIKKKKRKGGGDGGLEGDLVDGNADEFIDHLTPAGDVEVDAD